jgi:hypothetical protein
VGSDAPNAELVRDFFTREGWTISAEDDAPVAVRTVVEAAGARWPVLVAVTDDERIVVYSILPAEVVDESGPALVELVTRINAGLILGNFEIGDEGVRFKTSIGVSNVPLTDQLLRELVYPNVVTMELYLPILAEVAGGDVRVEDAMARLESLEADADANSDERASVPPRGSNAAPMD